MNMVIPMRPITAEIIREPRMRAIGLVFPSNSTTWWAISSATFSGSVRPLWMWDFLSGILRFGLCVS